MFMFMFTHTLRLVADVADAAVTSPQVLTDAVLTDVRVQGALVDVWEERGVIQQEQTHTERRDSEQHKHNTHLCRQL